MAEKIEHQHTEQLQDEEDSPQKKTESNLEAHLKEDDFSTNSNNIEGQSNDLDALLDDALEDFSPPPPPPLTETQQTSRNRHSEGNNPDNDPLFDCLLNDNDLMKMTEDFSQILQQMAQGDPGMMAEFQKLQEAGSDSTELPSFTGDFDSNIAKTMEELTKNLHKLETSNDPMEEMFMQAQKEMGENGMLGEDGSPSMNSFMTAMQGMMGNLLSKDLLYPSLKEIDERYPAWLSNNEKELSQDDYIKYKNQKDIVHQVCVVFENQKDDDSDEMKKKQSSQIIDLMQQMQQYGQPPDDMMRTIVGEEGEGAATAGPPPPSECSIM